MTVPPAATVRAATFSTPRLPRPALAKTSVRIVQPASSASMTSFSPSAMKACSRSRNFFSASERMSLTSGLERLVTSLTRPTMRVSASSQATQRENSEVDSARPADFSRMTSSPDSTVPPMPAKASRISAWMAKKEARIE